MKTFTIKFSDGSLAIVNADNEIEARVLVAVLEPGKVIVEIEEDAPPLVFVERVERRLEVRE